MPADELQHLLDHPTLLAVGAVYALLFLIGLGVLLVLLLNRDRLRAALSRGAARLLRVAPSPRDLGFIVLLWFALQLIGLALALHLGERMLPLLSYQLLAQIIVCLAVWRTLRRCTPAVAGYLGVTGTPMRRNLAYGLLGYLALVPCFAVTLTLWSALLAAFGIEAEAQDIVQIFVDLDQPAARALLIFIAAVGAPMSEELVFRGLGLPTVGARAGLIRAVLWVSLGFALAHFNVATIAPLFVVAVVCTIGYTVSGSIVVPIVIHALFNGVNLIGLALVGDLLLNGGP